MPSFCTRRSRNCWRRKRRAFSALGIGILALALAVNPVLAWGKYHYGKKLDSTALIYDAKDTLICQYQTIVVLIGLILTQTVGWWWADPVAALTIVPYVAWEGFQATRDAWRINLNAADTEGPGVYG